MLSAENIREILQKNDQEHLLQFWDDLNEREKKLLQTDVSEIDVAEVGSYFKSALNFSRSGKKNLDDLMKPIPPEAHGGVTESSPTELLEFEKEGLKHIANGRVGVLLLAGGQGTRLGVKYPKGMYDIGLPSHKSLYQIQAERIQRLEQLAFQETNLRNHITWYIMTSESTMIPTVDFFECNNYFGLDKKNIMFFEQGVLPCFDLNGKILMEKKYKIAKAPDGNGGLYKALKQKGILCDMYKRGIKYLHAYSVDNILVRVADPVFMGYCILKEAQCGAKVVEKTNPSEAVGVVCLVNGHYQVVEYSEITEDTAGQLKSDGKLIFNAGNICNHFFTFDFLKEVAEIHEKNLILHIAKKKIPFIDEYGKFCNPVSPNGIKMEKFVFDVFQFAENFVIWIVERRDEFSPLKNGENSEKENPSTTRNDLYDLHKRYVQHAGGIFNEEEEVECEISPLISYAGEGLKFLKDKVVKSPLIINSCPDNYSDNNYAYITNGYHA